MKNDMTFTNISNSDLLGLNFVIFASDLFFLNQTFSFCIIYRKKPLYL